jgi:hypothetical protein
MEKAEVKYEELKDRNKFEASNNKGLKASEVDVVALPSPSSAAPLVLRSG